MNKHEVTGFFPNIHYPLVKDINAAVARLEAITEYISLHFDDKHRIYFSTGTSGAMCLSLINYLYGESVILVAKDDVHHHRMKFEGVVMEYKTNYINGYLRNYQDYHFIFIDDFLSTGQTTISCINRVKDQFNNFTLDMSVSYEGFKFSAAAYLSMSTSEGSLDYFNDLINNIIFIGE